MKYGLIQAFGDIRFYDADKSNYVGLKSPVNVTSDFNLTLPDALPPSTRFLTTSATGTISYATAVSSVSLTVPNIFQVSGTPITDSGTFNVTLANANQNTVLAGPASGGAGVPTFRGLVVGDFSSLPTLNSWAAPVANVSMNGNRLTNLADPVNPQDAATRAFVEATAQGIDPLISARYITVSNIANILTANAATVQAALDPVGGSAPTLQLNDRVLVRSQTTLAQNGAYTWNGTNLVRSSDADSDLEFGPGSYMFVQQGNNFGDTGWLVSSDRPFTLGTSSVTWVQFSSAGQIVGGNGLTKTGNVLDVNTANVGRIVVNADNIDLATTGVTPGTYNSLTVDAYGRATAGTTQSFARRFNQTFVNANLTAGAITITHNLGHQYPAHTIVDDTNLRIEPDQIFFINGNSLQVDLTSYGAITGTYKISLYA